MAKNERKSTKANGQLSAAIKGGRRRGEAGRAAGEWGVGYIHGEEDWGGGCVIR